ncbi:MAG: alpha-L-glutamate ligase [Gammaproteobacteria bacterium]|nr:alpha-L-glutamate ligase [Gammaproteobacteria bacterium]
MTAPGATPRRVVIFTDDPGWHGRVLCRALAQRQVSASLVSLKDCYLDLSGARPQVIIPGFAGLVPAGVFVRGVPGGTLEEVILRLDLLHALDHLGVPVYNQGRAIERTVDKALTSFLLLAAGIATPRTWVLEGRARAREVAAKVLAGGGSLVLKPLFGSQGEGLQRITQLAELDAHTPVNGVFYLQTFIERPSPPYRDYRVLVVAGVARYAMSRTSAHWITNRALGAVCAATPLLPAMRDLAQAASAAVQTDYAGVDLLQDAHGRWWVGEVNGVPAWWGLQEVCGEGVTAAIVEGFCARLAARAARA